MTQWNQIRRKSREIVLKTLTTKTTLSEITGTNLIDKNSEEILDELNAHLQFTNNHYNRIIQNMIPLQGLQIIKNNEEKLQQIIFYIQQLELHAQQSDQINQTLIKEFIIEIIQKYDPMSLIGIDPNEIGEVLQLLPIVENIIKDLEKRPTQQQDLTTLQTENLLWKNLAIYLSALKADCTNHLILPYY